jgi:hypothetical protein
VGEAGVSSNQIFLLSHWLFVGGYTVLTALWGDWFMMFIMVVLWGINCSMFWSAVYSRRRRERVIYEMAIWV